MVRAVLGSTEVETVVSLAELFSVFGRAFKLFFLPLFVITTIPSPFKIDLSPYLLAVLLQVVFFFVFFSPLVLSQLCCLLLLCCILLLLRCLLLAFLLPLLFHGIPCGKTSPAEIPAWDNPGS